MCRDVASSSRLAIARSRPVAYVGSSESFRRVTRLSRCVRTPRRASYGRRVEARGETEALRAEDCRQKAVLIDARERNAGVSSAALVAGVAVDSICSIGGSDDGASRANDSQCVHEHPDPLPASRSSARWRGDCRRSERHFMSSSCPRYQRDRRPGLLPARCASTTRSPESFDFGASEGPPTRSRSVSTGVSSASARRCHLVPGSRRLRFGRVARWCARRDASVRALERRDDSRADRPEPVSTAPASAG